MLVVVDIANLRPDHLRVEMGYGPDDRWLPTTMAYIDSCLAQLGEVTPGSVVIKIADYALRRSLSEEDQLELFRRASLPWEHSDRIYLVRWADPVVLTAASHYGAAVVSGDKYDDDELAHLRSPGVRYFKPKFDPSSGRFSFGQGVLRRNLATWWRSNLGDMDPAWPGSEDHDDIAFNLRSVVHEMTAEFHSDVTSYQVWREGDVVPPLSEVTPPAVGKPKKVYVPLRDWVAPVPKSPPPGVSVPVFFCDDDRELAPFSGRRIFLVGRGAVRDGRTFLEWLPNDDRFEVHGRVDVSTSGINDFVKVLLQVHVEEGSLKLIAVEGTATVHMGMAEVLAAREGRQRELVPVSPWSFPRSRDALVSLKRLVVKSRRDPGPRVAVVRWARSGPREVVGRFPAEVVDRWFEEDRPHRELWMAHEETKRRWESDQGFGRRLLEDDKFRRNWREKNIGTRAATTQCVVSASRTGVARDCVADRCAECYRSHGRESAWMFDDWLARTTWTRAQERRKTRLVVVAFLVVELVLFAIWGASAALAESNVVPTHDVVANVEVKNVSPR